jgi:hypothetical protein
VGRRIGTLGRDHPERDWPRHAITTGASTVKVERNDWHCQLCTSLVLISQRFAGRFKSLSIEGLRKSLRNW